MKERKAAACFFPRLFLTPFYRCLLLKMTAIEKLQMLIEAAEYLDRRERGKVTYYIYTHT